MVGLKDVPGLLIKAYKELHKNDPLRLGAATAFFTIFALPPILLIFISLFGIIFNTEIISGELFTNLRQAVGNESADQVRNILDNVRDLNRNWMVTIFGFLFLIFIATTLFKVIQNSLNQLWNVKLRKSSNVKLIFKKRLKSFIIIISGGLLFLASLLFDSIIAYFKTYIESLMPQLNVLLIQTVQQIISLVIITIWFSIIFKYLPDCKIKWKPVIVGASLTAVLFMAGELILGKLLVNSGLQNIYGASGAIVLVLLFVFYSSFIFFFGAAFVKSYAEYANIKIRPNSYAVKFKIYELKSDDN